MSCLGAHDVRMTNTAPTATAPAEIGTVEQSPAAVDPRPGFARAAALGGSVISGVRPDQLTLPTPCDEYDVRALVGHLVAVLQRLAAVAWGESPFSIPQEVVGVPDDQWRGAWDGGAHQVRAAWTDDAVLGRALVLPFATLPGAVAMSIYTAEVTAHTWDLAKATGQSPAWDDEIVERALATMTMALPPEVRHEAPFDAPVAVADDAPLIDRFVAWMGRRP
jgi:uncharacterized protein (TIGR03086 family)